MIGITSSYGYTAGNLTSLTTPQGTTTFDVGQDSYHRWITITDPQGAKEAYEGWFTYPSPVASESTAPPGTTTSFIEYRNSFYWSKKAMQTGAGDYTKCRITHYLHRDGNTASNIIESQKSPFNSRIFYSYAAQPSPNYIGTTGQPTQIQQIMDDGSIRSTSTQYNSVGNVTQTVDPLGRTISNVYSADGIDLLQVYQGTPASGDLLNSYTYYPNHLVKVATDASGQPTSFTYNSAGQVLTMTNAKGEVTTYTYTNNQLTSVTGAQPGSTMSYTYDGFNRLRTTKDVNGFIMTYDYDSLDRVTKITYPDGSYEQNIYTTLDLSQHRDRQGRWSRYFYNSNRQMTSVIDSSDRVTTYEYCTCGLLNGITDPNHNRTSLSQDIQGRVVSKTYPDGKQILTTYENSSNRIKSITDPNGQVTTYTYNNDDTIKQINYSNALVPTPSTQYTYDQHYLRLLTLTDGTGTTQYNYNPVNGKIGSGLIGTIINPLANSTIAYTYDELGRVVGTSINGTANNTSVSYDSIGRVQNMTNLLGTFSLGYMGETGLISSMTSTSGPSASYSYFTTANDVRLSQIKYLKNGSSAPISEHDYTYNKVGTLATWQQQVDTATPTQWTYSYDGIDQLISATKRATDTNGVISNYSYSYDSSGNRTTEQVGLVVKTTSYNSNNQITGCSPGGVTQFSGKLNEPALVTVNGNKADLDAQNNFKGYTTLLPGTNTIPVVATDLNGIAKTNRYQVIIPSGTTSSPSYDSNGNMLNDSQGHTFEWDAKNELTAINYSGTAIVNNIIRSEFTYDGSSRRVKIVEKNVNSTVQPIVKQYVWVGNSIAEERDINNNVTKRYFGQGVQIGTNNYFYTRDHLGSIRELVDTSGNIAARYDYDPYGRATKVSGTVDSDFQYASYYSHAVSGLNLTVYRAYDSNSGRWLSRDPITESGGLNIYRYVANRPTTGTDIMGLFPSFSQLWHNYPGHDKYPTDPNAPNSIWDVIGGDVGSNGHLGDAGGYGNSCACRMSLDFNLSGLKIPRNAKGYTGQGANGDTYFYRVKDMQNFITSLLGKPKNYKPSERRQCIGNKTGIIVFHNTFSDASGHLDLYNGTTTVDGEDYSTDPSATSVDFYLVQ